MPQTSGEKKCRAPRFAGPCGFSGVYLQAMRRAYTLLGLLAFSSVLGSVALSQAPPPIVTATPAPASNLRTPPPTIYEIVARPICHELRVHLMPSIGMVLENDRAIGKAPAIFKDYIKTALVPDPTNKTGYDVTDYDSPGRAMAIQHMENLVPKLAQNVIAIQTILTNSSLSKPNPSNDQADAKALAQIRDQLLRTLAMQSASLDLINGFVTTQQLGDIQHAGTEYLSAINGTGLTNTPGPQTPDPAFQEPGAPGLPANPYDIEPGQMPGLAIGYNPVTMVADALEWVRGQTTQHENDVANSLTRIANSCRTGTPL